MKLTPQDKLALALTSAGSMRNLAALVGVTHQKIGRWLREGHPDGVKAIPREAHAAIDQAFAIHRDIAKQQARVDQVPFDRQAPVFMERKTMRNGEKGDRVFAEHTHFIRSGLRQEVVWNAQQSRKFMAVSIRSTVDIHRYSRRIAANEIKAGRTDVDLKTLTGYVQTSFEKGLINEAKRQAARELPRNASPEQRAELERVIFGDLFERRSAAVTDRVKPQPIFTKYANISPQMGNDPRGVMTAESLLRRKHEPATTQAVEGEARDIPMTRLADQLLFQLLPAKRNDRPNRKTQPAQTAKPRRRTPRR